MLAEQRRQKILELIQEDGSARVKQLSEIFGVSEPTIRQDLERLEADDYVVKSHGGAVLKTIQQQVLSVSLQHLENLDKKALIGKRAADIIEDGDSIVLDSGSTTTEIAKHLDGRQNLKIITNALNIALLVGGNPSFELMVTGGDFKAPTLSLTGDKAAAFFSRIHVNRLFLATGGISADFELTYPGLSDLPVKKAMMDAAKAVYLVADSTKFGRASFASLGSIDQVDYLITDSGLRNDVRSSLEKRGLQVIIAE